MGRFKEGMMALGLTTALAGGEANVEAKPKKPDVVYSKDQLGNAVEPEDFEKLPEFDSSPDSSDRVLSERIHFALKLLRALETGDQSLPGEFAYNVKIPRPVMKKIFERARLACNALRARLLKQKELLDTDRQKDFDKLTKELGQRGIKLSSYDDFANQVMPGLSDTGRKRYYDILRASLVEGAGKWHGSNYDPDFVKDLNSIHDSLTVE